MYVVLVPERCCIFVSQGFPKGAMNPSSTSLRIACGASITRASNAPILTARNDGRFFQQLHNTNIPASGMTVGLVRQANVQQKIEIRKDSVSPLRRYLPLDQIARPSRTSNKVSIMM